VFGVQGSNKYIRFCDSVCQPASPPVKSYRGIEVISIGRRFDTKRSIFFGVARTADLFRASREHFSPPPGRKSIPSRGNSFAARATRYDDIPFCMNKQSKTCASLKFGVKKKLKEISKKLP
jgi:hypothetical protein